MGSATSEIVITEHVGDTFVLTREDAPSAPTNRTVIVASPSSSCRPKSYSQTVLIGQTIKEEIGSCGRRSGEGENLAVVVSSQLQSLRSPSPSIRTSHGTLLTAETKTGGKAQMIKIS